MSRALSGLDMYRSTVVIKSNSWVGVYGLWLGKSLPLEIRGRYMMKRSFYMFPVCFLQLDINNGLLSMMRCWAV